MIRQALPNDSNEDIRSHGLGDHAKAAIDDQVKSGHREKA
jgi:hypothetical protein